MARVLDTETQQMCRDLESEKICDVYVDDPLVFPVEKILDIRAIETEIEYCVKWTDYSAEYNEWVAERHVTPDLKRTFSIENKKKNITRAKQEKAKARVNRKRHGRIAKSSVLGLTPTKVAPSTGRNAEARVSTTPTKYCVANGKSLPVTMLGNPEHKIPEWNTPKEANDASMSDATFSECDEAEFEVKERSKLEEYFAECHAFMFDATSSECDDAELDVTKCTTPTVSNEESDTPMPDATSSECDEAQFELKKRSTPKEDNEKSDASMSDATSSECDESEASDSLMHTTSMNYDGSGHEAPKRTETKENNEGNESAAEISEQNSSTKVKEENGTIVSATLPSDCSTNCSFVSMTMVAESESDFDSFGKKHEPAEYLLGFNEQLEPVFTYL